MRLNRVSNIVIGIATCLGLMCSGCSFAFSRAPGGASDHGKCSSAPPILDTVFMSTHVGGALWGLTQSEQTFGGSKTVRDVAVAADFGLAAIYAISAIYGYSVQSQCSDRGPVVMPDSADSAAARAGDVAQPGAGQVARSAKVPQGTKTFSFGMSEKTAEHACTSAGHAWRSEAGGYVCARPIAGEADSTSTHLKFAERGLWSIDIVAPGGSDWAGAVARLERGMRAQYGKPAGGDMVVPDTCAPETEIVACVERGEAKVSSVWQWPDGTSVALRVPSGTTGPHVSMLFERPERPTVATK